MADGDRETARAVARLAADRGGTVYYVGGCVRDRLRGVACKDLDIEVHGLVPAVLEEILDSLGERIAIGESFGIYHLKGCSLDVAMPRREENRGAGHRDFAVCVDPFIGTYKAALRRDFTFNALLENVLTGEITDHFGGAADLAAGVIRHVNDATFGEDPLRVLRAAQFAARFGFSVAPETVELCRGMDLSALPKERIMGELEKALLKADRPSLFFETLRRMGQLSLWFPELENTVGMAQDPLCHGEGDVWTHTMLTLDAAAPLREQTKNPLGFMLAALVHDFGKPLCTVKEGGRIRSCNHETLGPAPAGTFLTRLTAEKAVIRYALNLCELHMAPNALAAAKASVKATNRMFDRAADPEGLLCLARADDLGRIPRESSPDHGPFLRERLAVYRDCMSRPGVTGRDLAEAGVTPSPRYGEYLALAHKLQLAGVSRENALRQTLSMAKKMGDYKGDQPLQTD